LFACLGLLSSFIMENVCTWLLMNSECDGTPAIREHSDLERSQGAQEALLRGQPCPCHSRRVLCSVLSDIGFKTLSEISSWEKKQHRQRESYHQNAQALL
jgi:hypothetical protein